MAFDHAKFLARFVDEAGSHCARLGEGLLNLEKTPGDAELINALFRSAHTIKGSARMMKVTGVSELAHKMEDVLDAARAGKLALSPPVADLLFKGIDALVALLERVKAGETAALAPEALCDALAAAAVAAPPALRVPPAADAAAVLPAAAAESALESAPAAAPAAESAAESAAQPTPTAPLAVATTATSDAAPAVLAPAPRPAPAALAAGAVQPAPSTASSSPASPAPASPSLPTPASPAAAPASTTAPAERKGRPAEYLRVSADKLDDLVRLMGEIVSEHGRNRRQLQRLADIERRIARHFATGATTPGTAAAATATATATASAEAAAPALALALRQVMRALADAALLRDHLVAELRETSLRMRMQPLSNVFDPLRRTVRDLAVEHGKDIDFVIDGGETELDRKIIECIGDSLLHLIRNALDHGIENAGERCAAGKPAKGTLTLSACYDSGSVIVSLSDDGRGIDLQKIRDKAVARRLFEPDVVAGMADEALIDLIFMPGFSTSAIITDMSGRGVGMDVVRKSIVDELRGTVQVFSRKDAGTTFLLRLPLRLAVLPLFLFAVDDRLCAIPETSLVEVLSVAASEIIEIVGKRAIRLREQIIPVDSLRTLLGLEPASTAAGAAVTIVIIRDGEDKLGLIVDDIAGYEEMVIKPLPRHLRRLKLVSGVTIGDKDSIINVLHAPELIVRARQATEPPRSAAAMPAHERRVLVVDDSINTREIEKSVLEAYGYAVLVAEDGEDGWQKTRGEKFDLVITDVEMPRLDGFSFTERLRTDATYHDVPVIIVTSREKDEDKRRGIQVGANAYIVKGTFDQSTLIDTVRSLIG